jgi:hypothetical protein
LIVVTILVGPAGQAKGLATLTRQRDLLRSYVLVLNNRRFAFGAGQYVKQVFTDFVHYRSDTEVL